MNRNRMFRIATNREATALEWQRRASCEFCTLQSEITRRRNMGYVLEIAHGRECRLALNLTDPDMSGIV